MKKKRNNIKRERERKNVVYDELRCCCRSEFSSKFEFFEYIILYYIVWHNKQKKQQPKYIMIYVK